MASQSDRMSGYGPPSPEDRPADSDAIRWDIDRTRAELGGDVDRLADRTSPKRVVRRNVDRLGSRFSNMKESVMGAPRSAGSSVQDAAGSAASSVRDAAGSAADSVKDAADSAAGAVRDTPHTVARQTRGNPLAVGLIAFGAGLVAASLIPPSEAEKQAGQKLAEHSDELMERSASRWTRSSKASPTRPATRSSRSRTPPGTPRRPPPRPARRPHRTQPTA